MAGPEGSSHVIFSVVKEARNEEWPDPEVRPFFVCRGSGIRTHDLLVPNEARYQAAPHPVVSVDISARRSNVYKDSG
jgi:hypothetical protein